MINKLEIFERVNRLLVRYGPLLTTSQQEVMRQYFEFDLSLQEVAENLAITRAAVQDFIKQSIRKLENYEDKLHLLENNEKLLKLIDKIKNETTIEHQGLIEELERMIKDGI